MPIAKRPQHEGTAPQNDTAAEAFINGATPAAAAAAPPAKRSRKARIMTQFDGDVLDRVDTAAKRRGISRSAWIQFVVSRALDQGEG